MQRSSPHVQLSLTAIALSEHSRILCNKAKERQRVAKESLAEMNATHKTDRPRRTFTSANSLDHGVGAMTIISETESTQPHRRVSGKPSLQGIADHPFLRSCR
eukprot:s4531_g2.t1